MTGLSNKSISNLSMNNGSKNLIMVIIIITIVLQITKTEVCCTIIYIKENQSFLIQRM